MIEEDWDERDEDPLDEDVDDDLDESETDACPSCGAEMYEFADRCPSCGEWISHASAGGRRFKTWQVVLAVLLVVSLLLWLF